MEEIQKSNIEEQNHEHKFYSRIFRKKRKKKGEVSETEEGQVRRIDSNHRTVDFQDIKDFKWFQENEK